MAALFQEKLGATPAEVADIPAMTAFARRVLRAEFLQAGMGISGVNLAVADTGSICLVTNEGNGRLTTTLPRVHVALLGLERIVPAAADLGVVLTVLARSATGQASPVYTNVITGPRRTGGGPDAPRAGDPDGPDELHIVILDNGRSRLLGTPLAEILYCVRCGACLNVCPVYRLIGGHAYGGVYPGPVGSVVMPGLHGARGLVGTGAGQQPVRRVPRRVPGEDRPAAPAARAAGARPPRSNWLPSGCGPRMPVYAAVATRPWLYRWAGRAAARLARARAARRLDSPPAGAAGGVDRLARFPRPGAALVRRGTPGAKGGRPMTSPRERILASIRDGLLQGGPAGRRARPIRA